MKKRKILYLFPLAGLILSGCSLEEIKSWVRDNVVEKARPVLEPILNPGKEEESKKEDEKKEDQKPSGEDQKPSGEGEGGHEEQAHEHVYSELIPEVPATCTEAGMKAHYTCTGCDKLFDADKHEVTQAQLVIAALGHQMIPHAKVDAHCETAGVEAYYECARCSKLFSDEQGAHEIQAPVVISATGHHLTAHAQVDATCTEAGSEAYWSCDDCNKLFSDANAEHEINAPVVIAALGHDYATEWTQGETSHYHVCSRCGDKKDEAEHEFTSWTTTTEASYEHSGLKTSACDVCGKVVEEVIPAKTAEIVYNFASCGNPNRPGSPENDAWNWGTTEGVTVVDYGEGGYAFKFSMTENDAITQAFYQTVNQTEKIEDGKVVSLEVKNSTNKQLKVSVKNRAWNVTGEQFNVAVGATQAITVGSVIYNRESDNPAQGLLAGFAIEFVATDSSAFVGDLLITAPTEPVACAHASVVHNVGVPSNPYTPKAGTLDHYYCQHCGRLYADEAKTIELQESQLVVPDSFAIQPNWSWDAIPVYDADYGVLYRSPATFNDTSDPNATHYCAIESASNEMPGTVKTLTFKFKNGTNQKLTFEIRSRAWNIWYDTLQVEAGQWGQYTYTRDQWNADPSGTHFGFCLRVVRDKSLGELPTGYIYNALPEIVSYSEEEIAQFDSRLASVNVVDSIEDDTYLASFIAGKAVIDDVYKVYGNEVPTSFVNKAVYDEYLPFYQTNKLLFDGTKLVSRWGYGDNNVTNIQSQVINGVPYNKLTVENATGLGNEGFAVSTPRTSDSALIQNASKFMLRIYNPTNAIVSLRVHGGWDDWNAFVKDLTPNSWNTLIIDTTPFVKGDYFGIQFVNADADLSGEWLISSIAHYAFNSAYIWGFGSGQSMTVAPSWGAAQKTGKDDRGVYALVMSGGTSTMTATEQVQPLDENVFDHVEFYVYNDTGVTVTLSSYGENAPTPGQINLGQAASGQWVKKTISIVDWNNMGIQTNNTYTRYITYSADEAFSGNIYVTAFLGVGK